MYFKDSNTLYRFLSKFYDLFDLIFLLGGKGNPRSTLLEAIADDPQHILDVCVGTATSSILVATHHKQGQILGIDISNDMLLVAQRKINKKKLTNIELKKMYAMAMQLADNSFDVVMTSFALHELDQEMRDKVFHEVARVLKQGGKFFVIDFARQDRRICQFFLKLWSLLEPPFFSAFLDLDWRVQLDVYGFCYEEEREASFSKLYILRKT